MAVRHRALEVPTAVILNHHVMHASLLCWHKRFGLCLVGVSLLELVETLVLYHLLSLGLATHKVVMAQVSVDVACQTHELGWNEAIGHSLSG